jgi:hypothetical protein
LNEARIPPIGAPVVVGLRDRLSARERTLCRADSAAARRCSLADSDGESKLLQAFALWLNPTARAKMRTSNVPGVNLG